jgi:hypothetical protein
MGYFEAGIYLLDGVSLQLKIRNSAIRIELLIIYKASRIVSFSGKEYLIKIGQVLTPKG